MPFICLKYIGSLPKLKYTSSLSKICIHTHTLLTTADFQLAGTLPTTVMPTPPYSTPTRSSS
ncbi:hypothetical protein HanXRQr2_Chr16g0723621 [Helianthus annuus]|uniref:Uncharacterized protein n=1 Tax=Helianthus annuus TaxID=4232 RepID=A0A9K3DPJ9_HELAN|nr:hypothetical protein HanXRQr2_Chr16g0723621 [Helianthus annuus]